ncbi:MAG: SemiSWEET transporter [Rhodospirillales bacterium]|nr:SemiSWEET transporter [Rhodospirillales bacterium]
MDSITLIGFFAATLTTLAFLPQVIQVWRTRSTKDISLGTFATLCAGIILWITYGALNNDAPLIIGNAITLVLAGVILGFKIRYK